MKRIPRYLRLFRVQLRASFLISMQYRWEFLIDGVIESFWTLTALVPLFVVYGDRASVAGWTFGEALLVAGFFTLLQGILEGAINPSLTSVVEHIRKGTLDFVLMKPADAQFLVSTSRIYPWRAVNVVAAVVIFVVAFHRIGRAPGPLDVAQAILLFLAATTILYAFWIMTVSLAFYVVKIDNLTFLFSSVFDAGRWPVGVFRGAVRMLFTFVIPLAVMTTFPSQALLGTLSARTTALSVLGAVAFLGLSRAVWVRAIAKYTSASS